MAPKKTQEVALNRLEWVWEDEKGDVHVYVKILRPPKGRRAREMMPRVLRFMSEIASVTQNLDESSIADQLSIIERFWSDPSYENELFPYILQIETDEEKRIVEEELTPIQLIESISQAAQYMIEESFRRPEVQQALKKSAGGVPEAAT